jgi:hypothetical protein
MCAHGKLYSQVALDTCLKKEKKQVVQPLECLGCQVVTHWGREAKNSGFVQRDRRP